MNLTITAKGVDIDSYNNQLVRIDIRDAEESDILEHFTTSDVIKHFTIGELLERIGKDEVKHYFDLKDNDED